jgi:hypothetical protein
MEDNFFGLGPFKSKRYWICQTGGMALWVGLMLVKTYTDYRNESDEIKREVYKEAVRSFPAEIAEVNVCRCKDCRYFRLTKKYGSAIIE